MFYMYHPTVPALVDEPKLFFTLYKALKINANTCVVYDRIFSAVKDDQCKVKWCSKYSCYLYYCSERCLAGLGMPL